MPQLPKQPRRQLKMEPTDEALLAQLVRSLEVMAQGVKDIAETLDALVDETEGKSPRVRVTSE